MKKLIMSILMLTCLSVLNAQNALTISPEKPKPGDLITVTYTPSGAIAGTHEKVEGVYYLWDKDGRMTDDLVLTKTGKVYTGTIQTDASTNFIELGFKAAGEFDNNSNNGYFLHIYENGNEVRESLLHLCYYYQHYGSFTGVDRNEDKAIEALEKELSMYPKSNEKYRDHYYRLLNSAKKGEAIPFFEKEISRLQNGGLKIESDYISLEALYAITKQMDKLEETTAIKREKFPEGQWKLFKTMVDFDEEKDLARKEELFSEILKNIIEKAEWLSYELPTFRQTLAIAYAEAGEWDKFEKKVGLMEDPLEEASAYNSAALKLLNKNENLDWAMKYSEKATAYAKKQINNPNGKKPRNVTTSGWERKRQNTYAAFADTYAMVMFKRGEYASGLPFAEDAAINIGEGMDADKNNTYALIADKVLADEELVTKLEQFVKKGKASSTVVDILKRRYIKSGNSETFDEYITGLENESHLKRLRELQAKMISTPAPAFTLKNIEGKTIDSNELRGKILIVDFWATWCGPCKESFPSMQKMVNKYKDNPGVQFLFVNSWESGDDKILKVQNFIDQYQYTFNVLMDLNDEVIEKFKVQGIPTKFVIDKKGIIRFESNGFYKDHKQMAEIDAMIEMAQNPEKAH